jgi:phage terminase small subunit
MAKPRTPSTVLEARGAFDKDPSRRREDFEAGEFDPKPPTYFKAHQKAVWNEIVGVLPATVLQATDRMAVELAARLIAQFRKQDDAEVTSAQVAQIRTALAVLGMTPADRSRVSAKKQIPSNPFLDMMGGSKKAH